jgi:pimeloyl-ACP methyl ester carboxylesterase
MLLRLGVVLPPILIAMIGTGCRTVWRDPTPTPWTAALARPVIGDVDATDDSYHSVCSAWTKLQQTTPGTEAYERAWTTYHTSLARLLSTARDEGRFAAGRGVTITSTAQPTLIPVALRSSVWRPADVQVVHPVGEYRSKLLTRHYRRGGWGVPVVVERPASTGRYAEDEFLPPGMTFAATAVVRPDANGGAVLELFDPLHPDPACADPGATLARDLSAPFALRVFKSPELVTDWMSFFGVDVPTEQGLFFLEPYQPGKIPVVMVHGLLANPAAWMDMANDLRATPGFSERFQLWGFRYDTGDPFLASAGRLRGDLSRAVATVDPGGVDPALSQIALVGHSMGGLVSELQACGSEDRLWNAVANRPLAAIVTTPETRAVLQEMFFFDPQPNVRCVISLGAPHQGSNWAERPVGRLGSLLAVPEAWRSAQHEQLLSDNPGVFSHEVADRVPTSVDMLRPDSLVLATMATLPANPCVRFHTVFGVRRSTLAGGVTDGVVTVESALSPRAESATGVEASHARLHRELDATSEVLRLLDEHWRGSMGGGTAPWIDVETATKASPPR